jgi:hypothetical protein
MRKWKSTVGFSGTLSDSTLNQLKEEFKDPICIRIPSLRNKGAINTLSKVVKVSSKEDKFSAITKTL